MEGENYILASSYWGALREIENELQPHASDSVSLASVRANMCTDHFQNRVTLDESVTIALHVLMHLSDFRSYILICFKMNIKCTDFLLVCRWRVRRESILSESQWNQAKQIFLTYAPRFFPDNSFFPRFVPLNNSVQVLLNDLQEDIRRDRHDEEDEPLPPPEKKAAFESSSSSSSSASSSRSAPSNSPIDMDGEQQPEEEKKADPLDLNDELARWFDPRHGAAFRRWADPELQPTAKWSQSQKEFPHIELLARRFLCIMPTSAPSERVWSGFGHVITKESSTIDSSLAAKIMYLRQNKDLLKAAF